MNIPRRAVLSFLVAAIVLFLGMLFWPFIVNNIIQPTALVIWFLLRILVLSIHQKHFWYAVICVTIIFVFRFLPREQPDIQSDTYLETNSTMVTIRYWRSLFTYNGQSIRDEKNLKRELLYLLASLYASKQSLSNNFALYEDLQQRKIPLPENIHAFLFWQEPPVSGGPLKKFIHFIRQTPREWIRRWSGQEKAEHFRMIDDVLKFMETSLEINNANRKLSQNEDRTGC
jgi:type IV secretory pathway VirB3-like protein